MSDSGQKVEIINTQLGGAVLNTVGVDASPKVSFHLEEIKSRGGMVIGAVATFIETTGSSEQDDELHAELAVKFARQGMPISHNDRLHLAVQEVPLRLVAALVLEYELLEDHETLRFQEGLGKESAIFMLARTTMDIRLLVGGMYRSNARGRGDSPNQAKPRTLDMMDQERLVDSQMAPRGIAGTHGLQAHVVSLPRESPDAICIIGERGTVPTKEDLERQIDYLTNILVHPKIDTDGLDLISVMKESSFFTTKYLWAMMGITHQLRNSHDFTRSIVPVASMDDALALLEGGNTYMAARNGRLTIHRNPVYERQLGRLAVSIVVFAAVVWLSWTVFTHTVGIENTDTPIQVPPGLATAVANKIPNIGPKPTSPAFDPNAPALPAANPTEAAGQDTKMHISVTEGEFGYGRTVDGGGNVTRVEIPNGTEVTVIGIVAQNDPRLPRLNETLSGLTDEQKAKFAGQWRLVRLNDGREMFVNLSILQ